MDLQALTDEELALALQEGNEQAFDEIVRRHQGRVYSVAYRVTSNREDALDVAQDALIKAYRKIDAWKPSGGFVSWLMRLTTNTAIDHTRRKKRRALHQFDDDYIESQVADRSALRNTETAAQADEIETRVQKAMDVLSTTQRSVFIMRHYEGMPLAEIAEALGCTVGSVKVHLFRSLKKMRKELGDLYEA